VVTSKYSQVYLLFPPQIYFIFKYITLRNKNHEVSPGLALGAVPGLVFHIHVNTYRQGLLCFIHAAFGFGFVAGRYHYAAQGQVFIPVEAATQGIGAGGYAVGHKAAVLMHQAWVCRIHAGLPAETAVQSAGFQV